MKMNVIWIMGLIFCVIGNVFGASENVAAVADEVPVVSSVAGADDSEVNGKAAAEAKGDSSESCCTVEGEHTHLRLKVDGLPVVDLPVRGFQLLVPGKDGSCKGEDFWGVSEAGQIIFQKSVYRSYSILSKKIDELAEDLRVEKAKHRIRAELDQMAYLELYKEKRELENHIKEERLQRRVVAAFRKNAVNRIRERERTEKEKLEAILAAAMKEKNELQTRCAGYEAREKAQNYESDDEICQAGGDDNWLTITVGSKHKLVGSNNEDAY